MGGKINIESKINEGLVFTIDLSQKISTVKTNDDIVVDEDIETADYSKKSLLIVDDNKLNVKVARKNLEKLSFANIDECYNGEECLNLIYSGKTFDIILMDIMMPIMDGEQTLTKLKENKSFNTPVIALTADAVAGASEKYQKEGFADYLAKPFTKDQIKEKLNKVFHFSNDNQKEINGDKFKNAPMAAFGNKNIDINEITSNFNNPKYDEKYLLENNIDYNKGIELFGDLDTYKEMMVSWFDGAKNKWSHIEELFKEEDMPNYAIEVHALKSDSKYFGFDKLAELSLNHELKSKENNLDYVKDNFNELKEEFNRIIPIVKNYLNK